MDEVPVVTVFLRNEGQDLLLRRSDEVGSFQSKWDAVSGHVADDEGGDRAPEVAARAEITEETGIDDDAVSLIRAGDPFDVEDGDRTWRVHPFLFDAESRTVETNRETSEYEWVHPTKLLRRETVRALWTSYDRVRPRVDTLREDREHGSAWLSVRALELLRDEAALAATGRSGDERERREVNGDDWKAFAALARDLLEARPSMAVVTNRVNQAMAEAVDEQTPAAVEDAAVAGIERALRVDAAAAGNATEPLPDRVATLSRSGTVLAALRQADPEAVLVAESRPGREGVPVAESLADDTDVTLTPDAAFPFELDDWDARVLVVGADRVLPDGRVLNKVGTLAAALSAPPDCPVYVVCASDKVATDDEVDLEAREPAELYDGDAPLAVASPTFDVTPAGAIDAVVTERGPLDTGEIATVADQHCEWADWD